MFYLARGSVPHKRHTQHRAPDGSLYAEELFGVEGFTGRSSLLYHLVPPTRTHKIEAVRDVRLEAADEKVHRHHLTKTGDVPLKGDAISGRIPLYFNRDVVFGVVRPAEAMPEGQFYRNGVADEMLYIHAGAGVCDTIFGQLPYGPHHHPFDLVGWDGYLWPFRFNIGDFQPITGRVHQPPPVHQTFQARNFVVCSFVPRKFDYHPLAIPAPYNHSNINSDEVIYYVAGNFMSRRGVEISSFTVHPAGIPHGPHPGTVEASIGKEGTEELAVMVDTFHPLYFTQQALELDDPAYPYSWLPADNAQKEASELAERGPEAFPD